MLNESLDGGYELISNSKILENLTRKDLISQEHQIKIGKKVLKFPSKYLSLQKFTSSNSSVNFFFYINQIN